MTPLRFARVSWAVLLVTFGCAAPRPSELPLDEPWLVAVKSARLTSRYPWITRFAHHSWIDVKAGDEQAWMRYEVRGRGRGVMLRSIAGPAARGDLWFDGRPIHVQRVITGAPAQRIAAALAQLAPAEDARYEEGYWMWPGPNSNTFVAEFTDAIPELACLLDHNACGKDWHGFLGAGLTPSRTGVHLDLPLLGAAIGLEEGVELHLLGLTAAVRLFPPSLALPFLPSLPQGAIVEWGASSPTDGSGRRGPADVPPAAPPNAGYDPRP